MKPGIGVMDNFPVEPHHFLQSESPFWRKTDKFCGCSDPKHMCVEALPAVAPVAPEVGLNFNMEEMLEALPAANGAFDMEMLAEVLPAVGGVVLPPPARRDPRERFMERPDGR